jgi:predicted secreted protein
MNIVTGIVAYVCIWWVLFFMILPWGVRIDSKPDVGMASSAPIKPYLGRKVLATTLFALIVWIGVYWLVEMGTLLQIL